MIQFQQIRNFNQNTLVERARQFQWKDSYASYVLGSIVAIVALLLVVNFIRSSRQVPQLFPQPTTETRDTSGFKANQQNTNLHSVVKGESLSKISTKYYGTTDLWIALAKTNNIKNASLIYPGQVLTIPTKEDALSLAAGINPQTEMSSTTSSSAITSPTYLVASGDTLWDIAQRAYNNPYQWSRIFEANNLGRLPNGSPLIHRGNALTIPRE